MHNDDENRKRVHQDDYESALSSKRGKAFADPDISF